MRVSRLFLCTLGTLNHVLFGNYTAIITEVFSVFAIFLFYIRFVRQKKHTAVCIGDDCEVDLHRDLREKPVMGK